MVSMTASLLGGGNQGANRHVCGLMTSGGTESILSAVKVILLDCSGHTLPIPCLSTPPVSGFLLGPRMCFSRKRSPFAPLCRSRLPYASARCLSVKLRGGNSLLK